MFPRKTLSLPRALPLGDLVPSWKPEIGNIAYHVVVGAAVLIEVDRTCIVGVAVVIYGVKQITEKRRMGTRYSRLRSSLFQLA